MPLPLENSTAAGGMSAPTVTPRLDSIDLLRGAIMILMSLDHVRDYFTHLRFPPELMAATWLTLFLTRWVTHFCAPNFFLLAGLGAALSANRGRSPGAIRRMLWTRGLWLVFLELAVFGFLWSFIPGWSFGGVIWALGWSMVALALLIRLPVPWLAAVSVGTIALHNLLDPISPEMFGTAAPLWGLLHRPMLIPVAPERGMWFDAYVLVPWFAVMAAGFCLGDLYRRPPQARRRLLTQMGLGATALFVLLRVTNIYGNPVPPATLVSPGEFSVQASWDKTLILFLNVEKYPPSLQFLLMTLGPGLIALALFERVNLQARTIAARLASIIVVFGRVPFFYYALHILVAHLLTVPVAALFGQPWNARLVGGPILEPPPPGYGFDLPAIYILWILVNVVLYVPCRWFADYKRTHRSPWLSYL